MKAVTARAVRAAQYVCAFACLTLAVPVSAQPDPSAARRLFAQGEQSYRVGQYEEAVQAWTRAYEADPRPRIRYNLSQAYERLGRLEDAIAALEDFLASTDEDDALVQEATARLSALRQRVAATGVRIVGGPPGARIDVDGTAWGATPRPDRIPLTPGSHRVSVLYPNGTQHDVAVVVPAGQVLDVALPATGGARAVIDVEGASTTQVDGVSVTALGGTEGGDRAPRPRSRALLYVGLGTAGVGVGLLAYGIGRQVALSGCSDFGYACLNEDRVSRQRSLGLGLGLGLVAGGATLFVIDMVRPRAAPSADVRLGVGFASLSLEVRR